MPNRTLTFGSPKIARLRVTVE